MSRDRQSAKEQPAYINYFFKGGYIEFANTVRRAFEKCGDDISDSMRQLRNAFSDLETVKNFWYLFLKFITFFNGGEDFEIGGFFHAFWDIIKFTFYLMKLACVAVFTSLVTALASVIHTVILGIFFLFTYAYLGVVKLVDFLFNSIKGFATSCPNCQRRYALPVYNCTCGRAHTSLVPGRYGIMKRRCYCGQKLATSFLNGRAKLPGSWSCPHCGYGFVKGETSPMQLDICIPVVGGPSCGKTCYISMAIGAIEKAAPNLGLDFHYVHNDQLGDDYEQNKASMEQGYLPAKTNEMQLKYYQFYLTPEKQKVSNLISFCDVAGETYERGDILGQQIGYRYAAAFMMLIDPLSMGVFRREMETQIDVGRYGASMKSMDEVLSLLITALQNMYSISSKDMLKTDVVVLFTKCDIPGLDEKIGETAVRSYMQSHKVRDRYEAQNKVCEAFLAEYEEYNFLQSLKSKFKSIQFFTCSALGHEQNGEKFSPVGVEDPALWIIDKVCGSIDLKAKWGKRI